MLGCCDDTAHTQLEQVLLIKVVLWWFQAGHEVGEG